jgi:hypothetical protein
MIAEQKLDHRLARLPDFIGVCGYYHAVSDRDGAGGLELGHFLDTHQAHAAGGLQRKARVIAKRGNLNAYGFAGLDEKRARGRSDALSINRYRDILYFGHDFLKPNITFQPFGDLLIGQTGN